MEWRNRRIIAWLPDEALQCSLQNQAETLSRRCVLDSYWERTRGRHSVVANEIACNHRVQRGATTLHWTIDLTNLRNDYLLAIFNTKSCTTYGPSKCLVWAAAEGDLISCGKFQRNRNEGDPNNVGEVARNGNQKILFRKRVTRLSRSPRSWSITRRHQQGRYPTRSAKNQGAQSKKWATLRTLRTTNLVKQS